MAEVNEAHAREVEEIEAVISDLMPAKPPMTATEVRISFADMWVGIANSIQPVTNDWFLVTPGFWKSLNEMFEAIPSVPRSGSMLRRKPATHAFPLPHRSTKFSGMHKFPWRQR